MKKILLLLTVLLMTSCASFQLSTLNHDPIYNSNGEEVDINIINSSWELDRLLRDDFQFRYNFAQYAMSQPIGFHFNNRMLRNTLGFNRFYRGYGYTSFTNRHQMWNDWVWGYPYGNGIGFTYSWNHHRWSSNNWNNPYGWSQWNGWGNGYVYNSWYQIHNGQQNMIGRRSRTTNNNRRRSTIISNSRRLTETTSIIRGNNRTRVKRNTRVPTIRPNNNNRRVIRPNNTIRSNKRSVRTTPVRNNTTKTVNKRRQ